MTLPLHHRREAAEAEAIAIVEDRETPILDEGVVKAMRSVAKLSAAIGFTRALEAISADLEAK